MFIPTSKNRDKGDVDGKLIAPLGFDPHHHLLRCYQKSDLSVMRTLITTNNDRSRSRLMSRDIKGISELPLIQLNL